jgi:hypothetical protein
LINGVDYSAQLDSYELSDSHIDQSGLVKTQGKIEFTRGAIQIDNWGLSAIPDGSPVTIDVFLNGQWQRHPRGALRSVGSTYNEIEETLSLEVGCILSARAFAQVPDVFFGGVTPGTSTGVQTVATRLLQNGGITTIVNNATGGFSFLDRPQMSGSAIETAGKMAASIGAVCWSDSQGQVRIDNLSLNPSTRVWMDHAYKHVSFERAKVGQPPTEEIEVSGSYREIHIQKNPVVGPPVREYTPSKWGGLQLQKESITTTTIDFGGGVETTTTISWINAEVVYRAWNAGGNGLVSEAETSTRIRTFDKNESGLLLSNIETIHRERGLALGPYLDWLHKNDPNKFASASRYGRIPAEVKEEFYTYNSAGILVQKETTTRNTLCNLLGELGDPEWALAATLDLGQLVVFEKTIETWDERLPGQWDYEANTWVAQGRASQGRTGVIAGIENQKNQAEYVAAIVQAQQLMIQKVDPVNSNSGQGDPPEAERMPAELRSESRDVDSIAYFPSNASDWQPRRSSMSPPYLPDRYVDQAPPTEFAHYYGSLYGGIQQAQWRTARITTPLSQWLIDSYRPWAAMDVFRYGTVYTLAISGTSWAGDQTECLVSIDGALLGERIGAAVTNGVLTNPGTLQPPYLSRGEDSVTRSSTLISSIGPSASYGVGSVTISGAQTYSEVIPIDVTTLSTLTTSDRIPVSSTVNSTITFSEVVDDNNNWIWFF